jgi:cold-inducible RNA-binding protein
MFLCGTLAVNLLFIVIIQMKVLKRQGKGTEGGPGKNRWTDGKSVGNICYTNGETSDVVVSLVWDDLVSTDSNMFVDVEWEQSKVRLYVGSLSYQTTEQDLADLFGQVGQVLSATVITDRETGRSKGFGFVEMSNDEEARRAIEELNGTMLGTRTIIVNEARERREQGYGGGRSGGGGGGGRDRRPRGGDRDGYRDRRY